MTLFYIISFSVVGGIFGLLGALIVASRLIKKRDNLLRMVSFAAGAMLSAAFFDLIPEAIKLLDGENIERVLLYVFGGLILFYVIEQLLSVSHCHHDGHCDTHKARRGMIILGDTVHNFLDGIAIAAALLVSVPLGLITAIAVLLHEIPQEIGDVGVLIQMGMAKKRAIFWNLISASVSIAGAVSVYFLSGLVERLEVPLISLTAGGFLYVATVDLLAEVHHGGRRRHIVIHMLTFFFGVAIIWFLSTVLRT
ncbi:MAG: Metal cation transporter, ZIP family [Parcubacteria group bacterium GW2011_GWC2_45_7]|nr:MAG: Metal cation transporter, ZIP family [Parcubacteria group bacterium GW2011_GWC2_45_7]KKU72860.1 MAG: Metal cation transporter, ZIP family [Parcubacteria group bacterium GW2011_GWA2_47_26]